MSANPFHLGDIIHGFCGGAFGRDSYACRRVEALGPDWIITRNSHGEVELGLGLESIAEDADKRYWCSEACTGTDERGEDW